MRHFSQKAIIGCASLLLIQGCSNPAPVTATPTNSDPKVAAKDKPKTVTPEMAARRLVKATTDPDAASIDKNIFDTTVEELISHKGSGKLAERSDKFEKTVWRLKATVESIELKKDGDYYMVLRGSKGGQTVVEVPDPKTCKGSPFETEITSTRKALEDKFHPTPDKKDVNEEATITGIGFLGFSSNPTKKGSGGITGSRLMPGTDVTFGKSK